MSYTPLLLTTRTAIKLSPGPSVGTYMLHSKYTIVIICILSWFQSMLLFILYPPLLNEWMMSHVIGISYTQQVYIHSSIRTNIYYMLTSYTETPKHGKQIRPASCGVQRLGSCTTHTGATPRRSFVCPSIRTAPCWPPAPWTTPPGYGMWRPGSAYIHC
jgi:hypothetical protein